MRSRPRRPGAATRLTALAGTLVVSIALLAGCTSAPSPTAAEAHGWGAPVGGHEFDTPIDFGSTGREGDGQWYVWDGPGYQDRGEVTKHNVKVRYGKLILTGEPDGTTGTAAYYGATQKYGRWEARVRITSGDPGYTAVALLWPSSQEWPGDGEINYVEAYGTGETNTVTAHYASRGGEHRFLHSDGIRVNMRQWHTYAIEWTPNDLKAYLDGELVWTMSDKRALPPGPMWHSFQVDNQGLGKAKVPTIMEVDWLRIYTL